jgi:hypothetical protein
MNNQGEDLKTQATTLSTSIWKGGVGNEERLRDTETEWKGEEASYRCPARQDENRGRLDGAIKGSHFRRRLVAGGIAANG